MTASDEDASGQAWKACPLPQAKQGQYSAGAAKHLSCLSAKLRAVLFLRPLKSIPSPVGEVYEPVMTVSYENTDRSRTQFELGD